MEDQTTTAVALVNNEQLTQLTSLNDIYGQNRMSYERALSATNAILERVEAIELMQDADQALAEREALDVEANNLLVKLRTTKTAMADRRAPYTKLFDEIRKRFTELEGEFDPGKAGSAYAKLQAFRDALAKIKLEQQRAAEQAAKEKMLHDTEISEAESACFKQISATFEAMLVSRKKSLLDELNAAKLETLDNVAGVIKNAYPVVTRQMFKEYGDVVMFPRMRISEDEFNIILAANVNTCFQGCFERYSSEMQEYRDELIAKIPGKKAELELAAQAAKDEAERKEQQRIADEAMKTANEEEAKRIQAEKARLAEETRLADLENERIEAQRKAREAEEAQTLLDSEAQANKAAEAQSEGIKATGQLNAMASAALPFVDAPSAQVRGSQEITVTNHAGWLLIVQFYFEREGLNEDLEKLEKKTLGSMKTFCEKVAQKDGEKIQSPYLSYAESVKTVAKK